MDNPIPDPLNLIAPQQVTIYKNNTITVPIRLRNTYNDSIEDVELDASSNTSANMSFQQDSFAEIPQGEVEETTMTVTGYRLGENFEVLVNATVGTPEFSDSALILFNSIEETSEGPQTEMLVTFARDLLQQNEECRELQTVLEEAQQTEDNAEKEELLNTVIQGCQYLIEETQVQEEQPTSVSLDFIERFRWFYAGIGVLLLALIGSVVWIEMQIRSGE